MYPDIRRVRVFLVREIALRVCWIDIKCQLDNRVTATHSCQRVVVNTRLIQHPRLVELGQTKPYRIAVTDGAVQVRNRRDMEVHIQVIDAVEMVYFRLQRVVVMQRTLRQRSRELLHMTVSPTMRQGLTANIAHIHRIFQPVYRVNKQSQRVYCMAILTLRVFVWHVRYRIRVVSRIMLICSAPENRIA